MTSIDVGYYFTQECFIRMPYLDGAWACATFIQAISLIGLILSFTMILCVFLRCKYNFKLRDNPQ